MPSKISILIFLTLLCSALVSCDSTDSRLRDIDSIMESDPETALEQLLQIQPAALSEDDYAYYALLYTQAQYKNNYIVDSDSLIKFAYAKYAIDGSDNLKMRTRFYNAKVSLDKKDYRSSMKDAVVAYDIAKENNISYWIAKSAELMADIFWYIYNYTQAELYTKEAVMNYLLAGRIDNHRYALCDLASTYLNENRINDAAFIVDSLYEIVIHETPLDSALLDYMSMSRSSVLLRTNRLDELQNIIKKNS